MLKKSYQDISKQKTTNTKKKELTPLFTKTTTIVAAVLISSGLLLGGLMSSHLKVYAQAIDNCNSQGSNTDGSDGETSDSAQPCNCFGPTDEIIPCSSLSPNNPPPVSSRSLSPPPDNPPDPVQPNPSCSEMDCPYPSTPNTPDLNNCIASNVMCNPPDRSGPRFNSSP